MPALNLLVIACPPHLMTNFMKIRRSVTMEPHQTFRHVPLAPHGLTQKITPQSDLFVLAHMGVPRINIENWTLSVTGLVRDKYDIHI